VLKQAGYQTIAVGKWGLQGDATNQNDPAAWPAFPTKRGFDYFFGYARHKDGHEHYPKEGVYDGPKQVWDGTRDIAATLDKCYTADLWTGWTKRWIAEHERTNASQPFFIYLAYDTPHAALEYPPAAYPAGGGLTGGVQWLGTPGGMLNSATGTVDSYVDPLYAAHPSWPDIEKRYATSVRRIDYAVGDLLQLLKDLNIQSNTFVVFTSDNGPANESYVPKEPIKPTFFSSYGPFDGIKRDCWEGGLRVPALVAWPGHVSPGATITRPSALYDWLPTFADLAGLPCPARADGVSLLPELTGAGHQRDRGYVYFEYFESHRTPNYPEFAPNHRNRPRQQMQMIRAGDYAGVRYDIKSPSDNFEIYNVRNDPQETNNLAKALPDMEQVMKNQVLQARRPDPGAPRPYDNELVPALSTHDLRAGVESAFFQGTFPWVPNFDGVAPTQSSSESSPRVQRVANSASDFGMLFSGYFKVPAAGKYTFYLQTDTGALLRVHDATVIDADFGYSPNTEVGAAINLQAGLHPFRLYYVHRSKAEPSLSLKWSGPGIDKQPIPADVYWRK